MDTGTVSLISAAGALEKRLETVSNNLANVNTSGFKEDQVSFREVLSTAINSPAESDEELFLNHENMDLYQGMAKSAVIVDAVGKNFSLGSMQQTDNPLDLALENDGFFTVLTPQGERFTRSGSFQLDARNRLVTEEGHLVLGQKGPITLDGKSINVGSNGDIQVDGKQVDVMKLVRFRDLQELQKLGKSFYAPVSNDNVPVISKEIRLRQGMVEGSNVNTVKEMTSMVNVNRAYESVQKAMTSIDGLNERAISLIKSA